MSAKHQTDPSPQREESTRLHELESGSDSILGNEDEAVAAQVEGNAEMALDSFIDTHLLPSPPVTASGKPPQLSCPVVIPQRRPGNKGRGFVKAYAPVLEDYGISQDDFLGFIRATNKAVQASKWIGAVQLAATGTSFVPNSIALGASVGVQIVAAILAKAETNWKTNSLLDRVNDSFFRPRGLFCLLMSYNPVSLELKGKPDDADSIARSLPSSAQQSFPQRAKKKLRNPVTATTEGEENLPSNVAPLVYVDEHSGPVSAGGSQKKPKVLTQLNDYLDRRAQARYAKESDGDVLSNPSPPQFKNRFLDPNHPATNGGLIGLVSGGRLTPDPEKAKEQMQAALDAQQKMAQEQQAAMMANLDQQLGNLTPDQKHMYVQQYKDAFQQQQQMAEQQAKLLNSNAARRRIVRSILYLMIVNMPSDEQIAAARGQPAGQVVQPNSDISFTTVEV